MSKKFYLIYCESTLNLYKRRLIKSKKKAIKIIDNCDDPETLRLLKIQIVSDTRPYPTYRDFLEAKI